MRKLTMAVIFGGVSEEHSVSIKSAIEVAKNLDLTKFEPYYIGITKDGAWKLCDGPGENWEDTSCPVIFSPDRQVHGLLVKDDSGYKTIRLGVVLPVLHGKLGEDGAIQGLFELSGIPYVGCDVQSSALCMDKTLAYTVVRSVGIATPNFWTFAADEIVDPNQFAYPIFVKPARSGSSFGITKVTEKSALQDAIDIARQFDMKVVIEEAITAREIGCAVMGNDPELITGEPDQITLSHGFFRIHQEDRPETGSENATIQVPAHISPKTREQVQQTAKAIYRALGCTGIARVDMFLKEDGSIMLNEVNTFPGLTSYSRYPRMMAAAGLSLAEIIDKLVRLARDKATARSNNLIH